jgi:predicted esterase
MSQGGVMSLYYGLSAAVSPAGIICFSGYSLKSTPLVNLGKLPCLIVHGNRDTTIKEVDARTSYKHLIEHKETVEYHTIKKLDHSVCLEQIGMIKSWLERTN